MVPDAGERQSAGGSFPLIEEMRGRGTGKKYLSETHCCVRVGHRSDGIKVRGPTCGARAQKFCGKGIRHVRVVKCWTKARFNSRGRERARQLGYPMRHASIRSLSLILFLIALAMPVSALRNRITRDLEYAWRVR